MISISTVQSISICFWFSISLTLCNMNSSSRVGNISTSTSICTMNCWYSSWGYSMDTNSVGNIGNTITNRVDRSNMSNMVNRRNMSYTISKMSSITKMTYTIAMMSSIAISTIESVSISFSSSKCCRTQQDNIPDHDDPLLL